MPESAHLHLLENYMAHIPTKKQDKAAIAYLAALDYISLTSPEIAAQIIQELKDQRSYLKLIASENFSSLAVQLAMGNLLTDKYAEGYAHHRFYAGCENVDMIEAEAISQLKTLFGCEYAYVQPHSGADANLIALWSILVQRIQNKEAAMLGKKSVDELSPEEYESIRQLMMQQTLMGLGLNSGGHLTHGYRHNISSKMMRAVAYEVDPKTELLNYDNIAAIAKKEKPLVLLAGYSAYPRKINFAKMREIADSVGAVLMVDMAHFSGLVAGKVFTGDENPIPFAQIVTSTTHKTLRGPRGGIILAKEEFAEMINKGCPLAMGGPLPHVMAAKAIAFKEANLPSFREYAFKIVENAKALAEEFKKMGARITTNGTDNHLMVLDVSQWGITGRQAESALREAHLTLNRNAIPFDPNGPWYTSGIRIGTPAITTLGMGIEEMKEIASVIIDVLSHTKASINEQGVQSKAKCTTSPAIIERAKTKIHELLTKFPVYPELVLS
jgi:glycine hydroxymethyltransferase